jgi:hypothetical protein
LPYMIPCLPEIWPAKRRIPVRRDPEPRGTAA